MIFFSLQILDGGQVLDWGSEQHKMAKSSLNQLFAISTDSLEITLNLTGINSEKGILYDTTA